MDALTPEDLEVVYDPLDVVENVLAAENLPFDRTEDGDLAFEVGQAVVAFLGRGLVVGRCATHPRFFYVSPG